MGQATFAGLPPGVYSVSEQVQAGWEAVSDNPQTVIHQDCEETEVDFKNKELPATCASTATSGSRPGKSP